MKIFLSDSVTIPYPKFFLLTPDGFRISINAEPYYNITDAQNAFEEWKKQYEGQGYYSSNTHGRIPLAELEYFMLISDQPFHFD